MKQLLTLCLFGAALSMASPLTLGTNWIVNGDAESGAGSPSGGVVSVPGWLQFNSDPLFTAVQYEPVSAGGFPSLTDPGPLSRGVNFFAGGPDVGLSVGKQSVDISQYAVEIDQGALTFVLSGYFGGWQNQDDWGKLIVFFFDAGSGSSSWEILGPMAAGRANQTGLFLASATSTIPVGTRTLEFRLVMNRTAGAYNDGYADNLSFVATSNAAAPEPATAWLAALGLAAAVVTKKGFKAAKSGFVCRLTLR